MQPRSEVITVFYPLKSNHGKSHQTTSQAQGDTATLCQGIFGPENGLLVKTEEAGLKQTEAASFHSSQPVSHSMRCQLKGLLGEGHVGTPSLDVCCRQRPPATSNFEHMSVT